MLGKNGGHHVVFQAEEHRKRPEYFGEVPNNFSLATCEKVKNAKTCLQKPLWAKWLLLLGESKCHHAIFHAEKHGKRPEYLDNLQKVFFFLDTLLHTAHLCPCDSAKQVTTPWYPKYGCSSIKGMIWKWESRFRLTCTHNSIYRFNKANRFAGEAVPSSTALWHNKRYVVRLGP